ncbi:hypothetical protein HDU99_002298, partial [Rhizoclosmatium hyalinum]
MLRKLSYFQDGDSSSSSSLAFGFGCDTTPVTKRSGISFFGRFLAAVGYAEPVPPPKPKRSGLSVSFSTNAPKVHIVARKDREYPSRLAGRTQDTIERYCNLMYLREMGTLRPGSAPDQWLDRFELRYFGGSRLSKAQVLGGLERWRVREDLCVTSDVYTSALADVHCRAYSIRFGPADLDAIEYEMWWTEARFRAFL